MEIFYIVMALIILFNADDITEWLRTFFKHRQKLAEINQKNKNSDFNTQEIKKMIADVKMSNNEYLLNLDDRLEKIEHRLSNTELKSSVSNANESAKLSV